MNRISKFLFVIALSPLIAEGKDAHPLFQSDAALKSVLSVPLRQLLKQRKTDERLFLPGHWSYVDEDGTQKRLSISVRTRGVFRRANCMQPPLQLNFKKNEVKQTLFDGQDKLKLVGPCRKGANYQQMVLLENIAYQLYNAVNDGPSFATRILDLGYVDTEKKIKPSSVTAFVIEDESDLAKRHGLKAPSVKGILNSQLEPNQTAIFELFQFMIGNTDFSTLHAGAGRDCCHNVKLLKNADDGKFIPVPYDFDSAGIVDAPYAHPSDSLPISSVRKRHYMGRCRAPEFLKSAVARFVEKKADLYAVVEKAEGLSEKSRTTTVTYLNQFFDIIQNEKQLKRHLIDRCRG